MPLEFVALEYPSAIQLLNPRGHAGLITLWSPRDRLVQRLAAAYPELLQKDSPLVAVTNHYGNGLPGMLVNLAFNPQVERIAVAGANLTGSLECLVNFFARGILPVNVGGV